MVKKLTFLIKALQFELKEQTVPHFLLVENILINHTRKFASKYRSSVLLIASFSCNFFPKVSDGQESAPPTPAPTSGIVGALMEVMQKRSKAIHSSGASDGIFLTSWCQVFKS